MTQPFASLYVHVPFCAVRCDYCAFYTLAGGSDIQRERYLQRVDAEFAEFAPQAVPLDAIFVGGGTPTHLTVSELQRFLRQIHTHFTLAADCEFTMEGNPLSLTPDRLKIMQDHGVNRISLGVESLNDRTRKALGRPGAAKLVRKAVERIRSANFAHMNCDLIYGAQDQTLAEWAADVAAVAEFAPDHVSMYALSIKPFTPLADRGAEAADDDRMADFWTHGVEALAAIDLQLYEISNLALPGAECRHNVDIWRGGSFAGAGPSACWFDGETRWRNLPDLARWLAAEHPEADTISTRDRAHEILCTGLRLVGGWERDAFHQRTGFTVAELLPDSASALVDHGLLELSHTHIAIPAQKLLLHQGICREL